MENYINKNSYPFKNIPLAYGYFGLEPYIDAKTMELHHDRHLQGYIDNLNSLAKNDARLQNKTLEEIIKTSTDQNVLNNAGGVYNHFLYFGELSPYNQAAKVPTSRRFLNLIADSFGSFENLKNRLKAAALSVFGSGYAWLSQNQNGELIITTTPNQNTNLKDGLHPLLNLDVWEHAYYLKNYNVRANYIDNLFNVIDWNKVESRLLV